MSVSRERCRAHQQGGDTEKDRQLVARGETERWCKTHGSELHPPETGGRHPCASPAAASRPVSPQHFRSTCRWAEISEVGLGWSGAETGSRRWSEHAPKVRDVDIAQHGTDA